MNPWHLASSELMIWGLVLHLVADWLFQSEWMAVNKMKRREHRVSGRIVDSLKNVKLTEHGISATVDQSRSASFMQPGSWYDRHPAAYVHSGIHLVFLAVVFGWVALPLAIAHFFIDLRFPVAWWSRLINQTQPGQGSAPYDMGVEVRIWSDQVFHIVCIAVAALVVGS